jgi:hypothetical protein
MTDLIEAIVLISLIFLMGVALGAVIAVLLRRHKGDPRRR